MAPYALIKTVDGVVTNITKYETEQAVLTAWKQKITGFDFILHSIKYACNETTKIAYQVWYL